MRGHHPGQVGICARTAADRPSVRRLDHRQRQVAVGPRAAVPGRVLADRLHAGGQQPRRHRRGPGAATASGSAAKARSPITSCAPGRRTSSTGAQTTSNPAPAHSAPISAPGEPGRAQPGRRVARRTRADGGGRRMRRASAAAAAGRRGRPPGRPSAPPRPAAPRAARRSAPPAAPGRRCCGANRITPAGGCARSSAASRPGERTPAMPTTAARGHDGSDGHCGIRRKSGRGHAARLARPPPGAGAGAVSGRGQHALRTRQPAFDVDAVGVQRAARDHREQGNRSCRALPRTRFRSRCRRPRAVPR